jgi:hypothetical protein
MLAFKELEMGCTMVEGVVDARTLLSYSVPVCPDDFSVRWEFTGENAYEIG